MDEPQNPTDHARTVQPRAGEWFKDSRDALGLALLAVGAVALAGCLFAAAHGKTSWTIWMAVVAAIAGSAGGLRLYADGRRLRLIEARRRLSPGDGSNQ